VCQRLSAFRHARVQLRNGVAEPVTAAITRSSITDSQVAKAGPSPAATPAPKPLR